MRSATIERKTAARSSIDPFSHEFLSHPYPFHEDLREAGPICYLETYGVYAMARYAEVSTALADWETYCSGRGVGIDDFAKSKPWRGSSLLLEVDPPIHTRTRRVMSRIMSPAVMKRLREDFAAKAETLADQLVERRSFDAIKDLAEVFPLQVFPDAVGLRPDGRENLLPFGNMVFNSFGPRNEIFQNSVKQAEPVVDWILAQTAREALSPQGFGAEVWKACDEGHVSAEEAPVLVRSMLTAGLDTTVNGLGNAVYAFGMNPDQWDLLRENPALLRPAFDEALRWESPVQTFFRTTTRPVEVDGIPVGEGEKVLLFLAAANRDPRQFDRPDVFDLRRRALGHVGFGNGIHGCVGQLLARLEADVMLGALLKRVRTIEITGEPTRKLNNTLRSLATLPVTLHPL